MTGEEKAAALLVGLDPKVAEATLSQLGPQVKTRLREQMLRLRNSPQYGELVKQVLREAEEFLEQRSLEESANAEPGPRLLKVTAPPAEEEETKPSSSEPQPASSEESDPLAALSRLLPERLALALGSESERTVSLVLGALGSDLAGRVFKLLKPSVRKEASLLMGSSSTPPGAVLERILQAIVVKERSLPRAAGEEKAEARFKKIADLLRQLENAERADAMAALQERDATLANRVREWLYVFEDILCLDGRSVQKVLAEIDGKTLANALHKTTEEIKQKIMDNLSKRAREGLVEEMEFLGTVSKNQVQEAQKAITEIIQKLDQAGEIVLIR